LLSQQLDRPELSTPQQVVHWLGGVQAQDDAGAKWSIGLRLPGTTETSVEQAIAKAAIVKTWAFRGTLHFINAADVAWLTALLAPTIIAGNARRYKQLGLDEADFTKSHEIIEKALVRDGQLTRAQIAAALEAGGVSAAGQRAPYLLQRASLDGLIGHGRPQGREATFVLLREWIAPGRKLSGEEALAEVATRYITGHGPATVQDFAWWSGLAVAEARRGLAAVTSSFVCLRAKGKELWAAEAFEPAAPTPAAYLLPPFDEYLLGYKDRSQALEPGQAKKVNAGGGMPKPTIVLNGRVIGVWQRAAKKGAVHVTGESFRSLSEEERALIEEAASRFGRFYEMPAVYGSGLS
jgi:hypothetical protein